MIDLTSRKKKQYALENSIRISKRFSAVKYSIGVEGTHGGKQCRIVMIPKFDKRVFSTTS